MAKKQILIQVIILSLLVLLSSAIVLGAEAGQILVNSKDWRDVYSGMVYGTVAGKTSNFLVSDRHATLILYSIPKDVHIWAFSSAAVPQVKGYKSIIESRGNTVEEFEYSDINLELAKKANTTKFIVLDGSYGYNAISVAPYAAITQSYVLFADKANIDDVESFLASNGVTQLIIYGHVNREVKTALEKFKPEIINKDGDRFLNNIEIVKKYQEIKHAKQVLLSNGEFIEKELMSGAEPVIFIGTNNVPDAVKDYVKGSKDISIGVLVGNELVGTATVIRRQLGISVFVKFAQGARAPEGAISQVEALDMFYLPTYKLNLQLENIKYNTATNQLEVALKNTEDQALYLKGSYSVKAADGTTQTVGDADQVFIDKNEVKTISYLLEPITAREGNITADVLIVYGESKFSLEKEIRETRNVEIIDVLDNCNIQVNKVSYEKFRSFFYVETENTGSAPCYADIELVDVLIAGEATTFSTAKTTYLKEGAKKEIRIKAELIDEDITDNEIVKVRALYGERELSLIKILRAELSLIIRAINYTLYALAAAIVIILILIGRKVHKKRKKHVV